MTDDRQWSQMSTLERTLRSHLYHPTDMKKRMEEALPGHIRRKEFRQAADAQDCISKAEREIAKWQHLIDLYLGESIRWQPLAISPRSEPPPEPNPTCPPSTKPGTT